MRRLTLGAAIAAAVLLGSVTAAHAQYQQQPPPGYGPPPGYYPPPPPAAYPRGVYRQGLVFGLALGGGAISASDCPACGGGIAGEVHLGGMINPRMAIMADVWGIAHPYGDNTLSNTMLTGALQYWVADQLWLKGGIGVANISLSDPTGADYGNSESALGLLAAGGFEALQSSTFALDVQLRVGYGAYSSGGASNVAVLVGLNWY
jgi:hypothetical protein